MADRSDSKGLTALNSATLGAAMPEITLPDGSKVQTGTIGALLVNVRAYNAAHAAGDEATMAQLKPALAKGLPLMDKAGLFGLFTPEEWIAGSNPGRTVVGHLYLDFKAGQTQA